MESKFAVSTQHSSAPNHLFWVYTEDARQALDSATWLETTRELRALGWRVTLIVAGEPGVQAIRGVEVYGIHKPNIYLLRQVLYHLHVLRLLWTQWSTTDVVLFHQMSAPWILPMRLLRALRFGGPRFIMDTRTVPMTMATTRDRVRALFDQLMNRAANGLADGQTAITRRMAALVKIPAGQLLGVWPSGVNIQTFAAAHVRQWPTESDPIQLIYIGTLRQERNLLLMGKMVEQANAAGMAFRLLIVGDGPERAALTHFAATTTGRVTLLPPVPHEQIPVLLAQAHIGILPFPDDVIFQVSSPIKLFEYMAAGLPILATQIDCHTDVLGDADYVFWAGNGSPDELYAALCRCWQARNALATMGTTATAAALGWTWAASANKLAAALTRACRQSKDRPVVPILIK